MDPRRRWSLRADRATRPASARRAGAPPRKHFVYQGGACGTRACPRVRPANRRGRGRASAWSSSTGPKFGGSCGSRPSKTSARSRKSHGRPRQPRPTTTPSQPVCRIMRSASCASQMSPLPSTGMRPYRLLELARSRSSRPRRRRAGRRCARAGRRPRSPRPRRCARSRRNVSWSSSMPLRNLMVTGIEPASSTAARTMPRSRRGFERNGRAAALARDLADRAAEVHVDVVDAVLAHEHAYRLADVVRIDAVELQDCGSLPRDRSSRAGASSRCPRRGAGP